MVRCSYVGHVGHVLLLDILNDLVQPCNLESICASYIFNLDAWVGGALACTASVDSLGSGCLLHAAGWALATGFTAGRHP